MADKMNPNLADAYNKAKQIREIEKGNPRIAALSPKARVKTLLRKKDERGQPKPVDQATQQRNDRAVADLLEAKGLTGFKAIRPKERKLPTPEEIRASNKEQGGPKEDLQEVSSQLGKASKMHGDQSKRVAGIAKGMKGEVGNPYMKRGKSKYGM